MHRFIAVLMKEFVQMRRDRLTFAVLSQPGTDLRPLQRQPHFDGFSASDPFGWVRGDGRSEIFAIDALAKHRYAQLNVDTDRAGRRCCCTPAITTRAAKTSTAISWPPP